MRIRDEDKIKRIYKAAICLISEVGIAGLTMAKLAKEAKLATGTVYIYFKSKEVLINKLFTKLQQEAAERFMQGMEKQSNFKQQLCRVFLNYLNHRIKYHDESVFLEQYYRSPYITKDQLQLTQALKQPVLDLFHQGQDNDELRCDMDVHMMFLMFLGFIRELAGEHVLGFYVLDEKKKLEAFERSWELIEKGG